MGGWVGGEGGGGEGGKRAMSAERRAGNFLIFFF